MGISSEKFCAEGCPVEVTLDVIGGKWKSVIVYHLLATPLRFNALQRLLQGITQRMLTRQLRELEAAGIIRRQVFAQVPPKVEYSLTDLGQTLEPLVVQMKEWGEGYHALHT